MQVATWNVNSIRARSDLVAEWLADQRPDVCCLQETKCTDDDFPFESTQWLASDGDGYGDYAPDGAIVAGSDCNDDLDSDGDEVHPYQDEVPCAQELP